MNRKTITILTLLALVTTMAAPATAEHWRESSDHVAAMDGVRMLRVENLRGSVEIRPGKTDELRVTAMKVSRGPSEGAAQDLALETHIETVRDGDTYVVRVHYPEQDDIRIGLVDLFRGYEPSRVEVRLSLTIPADLDVSVRASSGDIYTEDLRGLQAFETSSGDVTVVGAGRTVNARSSSGDVHVTNVQDVDLRSINGDIVIEDVRGPARAHSTGGDIRVREAADSLSLRTLKGDIHVDAAPVGIDASSSHGEIVIRDAAEHVRLSAANGEIDVALVEPLRAAEVSTVTGDIVARLGESLGCRLDARTTEGTLNVAVPLRLTNLSRHQVSGVVREGTAPVTLKSSAGDIELHGGGI